MRLIDTIIIHCADTRPEWMANNTIEDKCKEIERWHKARKPPFNSIGYHYIIDRDGKVAKGRDDRVVGAHCYGQNPNSIGICLLGGHGGNADDRFADHFTMEQESALKELLAQLKADYEVKAINIKGHNDFSGVSKACPCFKVTRWMAKQEVARQEVARKTPPLSKSTSIKGNGLNIASGASLAAASQIYGGFSDIERYVILGVGVVVLLGGLWLFRKKLLKLADQHGI